MKTQEASLPQQFSTKKCLICKKKNDCLHWHSFPDDDGDKYGNIYVYCVGGCQRMYSIWEYAQTAGVKFSEILQQDFEFKEAPPAEVRKMEWPQNFLPLYDKRSAPALVYLASRGIDPDDGIYYDISREGIAFPYFYEDIFCGAQIRLLNPITHEDGTVQKITTISGTRLGLLYYAWNQTPFRTNIKGVIVTEGSFNALCIQQALNEVYGGILKNPWKAIACSGSGVSSHHIEMFKELKESGIKVVAAPDHDRAGQKMLQKLLDAEAITHYALTYRDDLDWNDISRENTKEDFAKWFLRSIQSV